MQEIYRIIAWKIINLRQEKELTQEQLGNETGLSKFQIGRIEQGHGDTTLTNLNILAHYFEIKLEDLLQEPKRVEVELSLRNEVTEKLTGNITVTTFSKAQNKSAKIKKIEIPTKTAKRIRIDSSLTYDCFLIEGEITLKTSDDMIRMKAWQVVTVKGNGLLKLVNIQLQKAVVVLFAY